MTEPKKQNMELVIYRLDEVNAKIDRLDRKVDHNFVNKYAYTIEMAAMFGVQRQSISKVHRGLRWSHV